MPSKNPPGNRLESPLLSLGHQTAARAFSAKLTRRKTFPLVLPDFPANPKYLYFGEINPLPDSAKL